MRIRHARIGLELHELKSLGGPALLLLHSLYGSSTEWGDIATTWPGRVYALDFCGHGQSDCLTGGGYMPELLAGDADAALRQIGRAAIAGAGIGAYVALLLAGGRPNIVPAALLLPGSGLAGGGAHPNSERQLHVDFESPAALANDTCDPMVGFLDHDVRPADYAAAFANAARMLLLAEDGSPRPPWWEAVRKTACAERASADLHAALARLAAISAYG